MGKIDADKLREVLRQEEKELTDASANKTFQKIIHDTYQLIYMDILILEAQEE